MEERIPQELGQDQLPAVFAVGGFVVYDYPLRTMPPAFQMNDSDSALDYLEQQIPSLSAAAVDVAYWQALSSGLEVLISDDDGIYQALPDGTKKLIKPTDKPLSIPVGTRIKIP